MEKCLSKARERGNMTTADDLHAAQEQLRTAMESHATSQQQSSAPGRTPIDAPLKVKVRVTLDEVSLRLTCNDKTLNKKLLDACVVPFLKAYNKRVETHKQVELEELMSISINDDLIGREDLEGQARYILGRASARAIDNGKTTDGEEDDILMKLGTRETHEREWQQNGRP